MKILIVSQYFWPETFRINDLAYELYNQGYKIEVLTGKPNYPTGSYYEGYSFFTHNEDDYKGFKIYRVPIISRGNGNGLRLILNYLSFVFNSSLFVLFSRKKYDITFTFAVSPITQAFPALLHKKLYKSSAIIWLQDLWPESITAAGKIKNPYILRQLLRMVQFIYRYSDKILIQSEAFETSVLEKCNVKKKIYYFPYWAEDLFLDNSLIENGKNSIILPNGFKIMFAGNIGESQDFEAIINAAEITKVNPEIKWIIIGDGRKKIWAETEAKKKNLESTVLFLGRYPIEEMPRFFEQADIMLISLKNEPIFTLTIPSKIQSYMAFGKPILSMMNGIGSQIIDEAKCGYTVSAGDYTNLADKAMIAFAESKESLIIKGNNAKKYYLKNFSKEILLEKLINIFNT